jgi:tetratricopeptide (TPR) repeat protein
VVEAPAEKKYTDWTVEDHIAAGDRYFAKEDLDNAHGELKKALGKLGTAATPARAEIYIRIAQILRKQGNGRVAVSNFEKALGIVPNDLRALGGLIELHAEQGNWRSVFAVEDKLLASLPSGGPERLAELLSFGDRALGRGDANQAKARFIQARDEYPRDLRPLEKLQAIFEEQKAIEHVLDNKRRIAALLDDPSARARAYLELGQYCLASVQSEEEALAAFELALDSDPTLLQALEVLAGALAESQEWAELERVYRKMIRAFTERQDGSSRTVLAELHRKLALLYRDHLEDPEQALAALDGELAIRPYDLSGQLLAAEISDELAQPAKTLVYLRKAAEVDPTRVETYRRLYALGHKHGEPETSFLAASVTVARGKAEARETATYERHKVDGVPPHKRPIRREAWSWLRDRHHDPVVDRVMSAVAPAVLRTRVLQLEERGKLPPLPERQDPKTSTVSVVRSIGWASQFLAVDAPAIYIDDKVDVALSSRFAKHQTTIIGRSALRGKNLGELAFLVGRHLALRTPEHELVAHMQSIDELSACFLAAIKLVLGAAPAGPLSTIVDNLARLLATQQTDEERAALDAAVRKLAQRGDQLNLGEWVASVERCATRAGYLLCGDLCTAVAMVESEGDSPFSTAQSRVDDLCAFAVSGSHMKLRQELGSSLIEAPDRPRISMPPAS